MMNFDDIFSTSPPRQRLTIYASEFTNITISTDIVDNFWRNSFPIQLCNLTRAWFHDVLEWWRAGRALALCFVEYVNGSAYFCRLTLSVIRTRHYSYIFYVLITLISRNYRSFNRNVIRRSTPWIGCIVSKWERMYVAIHVDRYLYTLIAVWNVHPQNSLPTLHNIRIVWQLG